MSIKVTVKIVGVVQEETIWRGAYPCRAANRGATLARRSSAASGRMCASGLFLLRQLAIATRCRNPGGGDPGNFSEDCFYLRTSAPAVCVMNLLPVMVWLHGGGYTIMRGSLPPYDGQALAKCGA